MESRPFELRTEKPVDAPSTGLIPRLNRAMQPGTSGTPKRWDPRAGLKKLCSKPNWQQKQILCLPSYVTPRVIFFCIPTGWMKPKRYTGPPWNWTLTIGGLFKTWIFFTQCAEIMIWLEKWLQNLHIWRGLIPLRTWQESMRLKTRY